MRLTVTGVFGRRGAPFAWRSMSLFVIAMMLCVGAGAAEVAASRLAQVYLDALTGGDVTTLRQVVDGPLKERNRHLGQTEPDRYGEYLRELYSGFQAKAGTAVARDNYFLVPVSLRHTERPERRYVLVVSETGSGLKVTDELAEATDTPIE